MRSVMMNKLLEMRSACTLVKKKKKCIKVQLYHLMASNDI